MRSIRALATLAISILTVSSAYGGEHEFAFLTRSGEVLTTTHRLPYQFKAEKPLRLEGPKNRTATFNDVPFEISLAAFVSKGAAVMVHAERVADGSGASNYTRFALNDWPDGTFRLAPTRCFELSAEAIDGEHDLEWLRDHGFDPAGTIHMEQYFASTDDFNDEIVVSFLRHTQTCEDAEANSSAMASLRAKIKVTSIKQ